jgi:hypothetical protein
MQTFVIMPPGELLMLFLTLLRAWNTGEDVGKLCNSCSEKEIFNQAQEREPTELSALGIKGEVHNDQRGIIRVVSQLLTVVRN